VVGNGDLGQYAKAARFAMCTASATFGVVPTGVKAVGAGQSERANLIRFPLYTGAVSLTQRKDPDPRGRVLTLVLGGRPLVLQKALGVLTNPQLVVPSAKMLR
jgi:hypothetical protein